MQRSYPPDLILSAASVFTKFDQNVIRETLNCLIPEKLRMFIISKSVSDRQDLQEERWYGTKHCILPISSEFIIKLKNLELNPELHLPKPNIFIPTDFELTRTDLYFQKYPVLLLNTPLNTLWHHRGAFEVPKACLCVFIQNPFGYSSPRSFSCLELLKDIVIENLAEYGYDAQIAGLNYDIDTQYRGINIIVQGYNDKLEVLLSEVIKHFVHCQITEPVFSMCKEKMVRMLQNASMNAPVSHAGYYTSHSLLEKLWTNDEKSIEAPHITLEEVRLFSDDFFSRAYVETLVVGNISPEHAVKLLNNIQQQFDFKPLHSNERIPRRNIYFSDANCAYVFQKPVFDSNNVNSAIEFYLDLFSYCDMEMRVYSELIAHLISEPVFNQLRTVEQLGYIVFGGIRNLSSRGGIRILIQSEKDPIYLESRIENFLELFLDQVKKYSEKDFKTRVDALIAHKLKKDENLAQLARRDWETITSCFYDFDSIEKSVEMLKCATQEKTVGIIRDYVLKNSPKRCKFSLHLRSQKLSSFKEAEVKLEDCGSLIESISDWKASQFLSPSPTSMVPLDTYYWDFTKNSVDELKANL